ncbi:hypothetical protein P0Y43_16670 [Pseudomonas entomophila]|uniref:hypothetical protein n=1 Tax=Pseudomonas entomophila TaxID=312306 RepID=UPI0023D887CA|nr:hypothetical protein [Pseudomonas entomophila]MDF0732346.1 hypothetical protein [Pseudomonas entomophila]
MSPTQLNLEMLLAFDEWAVPRGFDVTSADGVDGPAFKNVETQAAWLGFEAAHGDAGCRPYGQQLYARIKRSSEYAHQAAYSFTVRVGHPTHGEYGVYGGPGGVYRLRDVDLFVIVEGKEYGLS